MANFGRLVESVIMNSDIVLMVVDARHIDMTINEKIESDVRRMGRKLIYVINKCDLVDRKQLSKIKLENSVKVSAIKKKGTLRLMGMLEGIAGDRHVTIGVVGFPNTGKSTLINALKGKRSARTSPVGGFTKGLQKVRITDRMMMIDTPGVFSHPDQKFDAVFMGAVDPDRVEDPEAAAVNVINLMRGKVESYFHVKRRADAYETLEEITLKKKILRKGGLPDTRRMAMDIIRMCQKGKIR